MLFTLALVLLASPAPPVPDSVWAADPSGDWLTVDNLTARIERRRDAVVIECGAEHPADAALDLRVRAVPGRRVIVTASSPDTPFARCVADALTPGRPPSDESIGELPPRRFADGKWSWYTFDRRLTLKIPPPGQVLLDRLESIGRHGLDCWGFGQRPVRELRVRLISNPIETRIDVQTDPPEPAVAGCFRREAEKMLDRREGGQWAVDHTIVERRPVYMTERRLRRAVGSKVCRALITCLDRPVPPADCPPDALCAPFEHPHQASYLKRNVKRLGLPEEVSLSARVRAISPAEPLRVELADVDRIDARVKACIEQQVAAETIHGLVHQRQPVGPFIDATPAITIAGPCKTRRP